MPREEDREEERFFLLQRLTTKIYGHTLCQGEVGEDNNLANTVFPQISTPGAYWRAALIRAVLIRGGRLLEGGANSR